jgi:hypothetical protein
MSVYDDKIIPRQMQNYCVQPHWDANAIFRYSIPQNPMVALPITPRPYAKINLEYRTSAPFEQAPDVPDEFVVQGAAIVETRKPDGGCGLGSEDHHRPSARHHPVPQSTLVFDAR